MITQAQMFSARVMIVDEQAPTTTSVSRMLSSSGFGSLLTLKDLRDIVRLYIDVKPDLIVMDLREMHPDGLTATSQLRQVDPELTIPIMMVTARLDPEIRSKALEMGVRDILVKPLDRMDVLTRIRNLLDIRLLQSQVRNQIRPTDEKSNDRIRELCVTQLELIHRLGRTVEYRDNETGMHVIRMGHYALAMAKALNLPSTECELLLHAAPLHDVGKVGIPDRIIQKKGPLTPEEWMIMKTHPIIGANLLSNGGSKTLQMAESIALSHHEKWDGTGYPYGMQGEEIPLPARIVALCDVFDALISNRPHKAAWSIEETVAEIDRRAGSHFDPTLSAVFHSVVPQFTKIHERFHDDEAAPTDIANLEI